MNYDLFLSGRQEQYSFHSTFFFFFLVELKKKVSALSRLGISESFRFNLLHLWVIWQPVKVDENEMKT